MVRGSSIVRSVVLAALIIPSAAQAKPASTPKLDESLRETVDRGCIGTQQVIIRTKPGYRQGTRASLELAGDGVTGEFPALDAVVANVSCDHLDTLANFSSTDSVSSNARVGVQSVDYVDQMQANVSAAQSAFNTARNNVLAAGVSVLANTIKVAYFQSQVDAALKTLNSYIKLYLPGSNLLATAQAQLAAAQA